jgi:hypothetical protein
VKALETVDEHRAVLLVERIRADLDDVIGSDADYMPVEGRVVERAQSDPIGDRRNAARIGIRQDVRGVEQFLAAQTAYRAVMLIRTHDPFAKLPLMQALLKYARGVSPADLRVIGVLRVTRTEAGKPTVINTDGEREATWIVANDVDGPFGDIQASHDIVEVNKWDAALFGEAQADVLVVLRVRSSVSLAKQTVFAECVVVRARLALDHRDRRDAKRNVAQQTRLEDSLRSHQRHALAFVNEPFNEDLPREDALIRSESSLLLEESERSQSNLRVVGGHGIAALSNGRMLITPETASRLAL